LIASTLYSMLGDAITSKARFQWVKTFGRDNILSGDGDGRSLLVKNSYIVKAFYDSKAQGRTTCELANVMIYTYLQWISRPENQRITGVIAEEIHNRVMRNICVYWKRDWAPEKHKCPVNGIVNLFRLIRSATQADLIPNRDVTKKCHISKIKSKEVRAFWEGLEYSTDLARQSEAPGNSLLDWSVYHQETPMEVLIHKESSDAL